jgi:hypothetical protein
MMFDGCDGFCLCLYIFLELIVFIDKLWINFRDILLSDGYNFLLCLLIFERSVINFKIQLMDFGLIFLLLFKIMEVLLIIVMFWVWFLIVNFFLISDGD